MFVYILKWTFQYGKIKLYIIFPRGGSMIKAAIFDLDHTLFDRYETIRLVVPKFRLKFHIAEGITDDFIYENLVWADKHYVHHGWEEIYAHLCSKGIFEVEPGFEGYTEYVLSCFKGVAVKYPFSIPMLRDLRKKGIRTGLITNGRHDVQVEKLAILELNDCFDEIIISGDCGYAKPDPKIFELMSKKLGIKTNEMMYIGDHPLNDVDGSRNAGCVPVWVKTTGTWIFPELEKCELQVETVEEIPAIIDKLNGR